METRVAVLGCGAWGLNLVRNFHGLGALAAAVDSDDGTRGRVATQFPGVALHASADAILGDPSIPSLVVATPAATHHAVARQALLAGKDVFVEKPLAMSVREGEELVRIAAERGRVLMVGHLLAYHPAVMALKDLVDRGELGRIQYVYSHRLNLGRIRSEENILWSFAPHDITAILLLLGEMPTEAAAQGWNILHRAVADVTVTTLRFPSGAGAHIFVSWLNPFKEHRLVVVGDRKMAVFDDTEPKDKLVLYPHHIDWIQHQPVPRKAAGEAVPIDSAEPLRRECEHFLECVRTRATPRTDGASALRVLAVLEASQRSLESGGRATAVGLGRRFEAHETAVIDEGADIGQGTHVWHWTHVMSGARIGKRCSIGQNCFVGKDVRIGDNVKIQNNVSVYEGVTLEDDVFCGPSMVFTNVINPRSHVSRKHEYKPTLVRRGATLGAHCTVLCGHAIGRYAFVGAGAVVTKDVPDYALVLGAPARVAGWVCACGVRLGTPHERVTCGACSASYEVRAGVLVPLGS